MRIKALEVRRFRSVQSSGLAECGDLNVLVGKNNAGKSNLLSAIEIVLRHFRSGTVTDFWRVSRPQDEFTGRVQSRPIQIGIEFELDSATNTELRKELTRATPHLQKAIDQIAEHKSFSVILAARVGSDGSAFTHIQDIGPGTLVSTSELIEFAGVRLLGVSREAAIELFEIQRTVSVLSNDIEGLNELSKERRWMEVTAGSSRAPVSAYWNYEVRRRLSFETTRELEVSLQNSKSADESAAIISQMIELKKSLIETALKRETTSPFQAFAGEARIPPPYITWILNKLGAIDVKHFKEDKQKIGREEAGTFVRMKVRRGGPEQLGAVQHTIKELLGVHVDAFQPEDRERGAEMDVDQFLVEANGAGIREALRIILDLELKNPDLALIEEPEVHLHPGLERVVAGYLRNKSKQIQIFITTHSTEFVDSITFQNAYLISRDSNEHTVTQVIRASEAARIPAELGLRLSSLFMYDRLVFVEGDSDENVLRTFGHKLELDLAQSNVGFVHMKGVRNFAHFAAESTLELLSKRQIQIWFVTDRDERNDEEVKRMLERLHGRAKLYVLPKRELENYLMNEDAILRFIEYKQGVQPRSRRKCRARKSPRLFRRQ